MKCSERISKHKFNMFIEESLMGLNSGDDDSQIRMAVVEMM